MVDVTRRTLAGNRTSNVRSAAAALLLIAAGAWLFAQPGDQNADRSKPPAIDGAAGGLTVRRITTPVTIDDGTWIAVHPLVDATTIRAAGGQFTLTLDTPNSDGDVTRFRLLIAEDGRAPIPLTPEAVSYALITDDSRWIFFEPIEVVDVRMWRRYSLSKTFDVHPYVMPEAIAADGRRLLISRSECPFDCANVPKTYYEVELPDVASSANIAGRVVDATASAVPGVTIAVVEATDDIARYGTSGSNGEYLFDGLPDGTYRVDFESPGFGLLRHNNVHVHLGATARVDAILSPSARCECVSLPRIELRERAGQVVDESGRPLAYARLEVIGPSRREVALADGDGRFSVRLPANDRRALTASDSGRRAITQQVSGADSTPVVFTLPRSDTTVPSSSERFSRRCRCPDDLFQHPGR